MHLFGHVHEGRGKLEKSLEDGRWVGCGCVDMCGRSSPTGSWKIQSNTQSRQKQFVPIWLQLEILSDAEILFLAVRPGAPSSFLLLVVPFIFV